MPLDVPAVQAMLRKGRLDGWLLYDFHGSNPIAQRVAGLATGGKMATRRWYYLVPAQGTPRGLVHAIERHNLDAVPGSKTLYSGRMALAEGLRTMLAGCRRIAMEYSPDAAIPYLSRLDAGTMDVMRGLGIEVISSGDLVQRFEASWGAAALATHRAASDGLYRVKDRAFEAISARLRDGVATTERDIQELMMGWFADEGLVSGDAPIVAAQENAGDPHYAPTAEKSRRIEHDELVLLDLWAKLDAPGAVFADITWVGYTGAQPPQDMAQAFATICAARDSALALVQSAAQDGRDLRGWQVDRSAREVLESAGYGDQILHRTGHSLGEDVHGNGVHMDDFETHDDRRVLPGAGFTIEPGLYFDTFGVRTEINVYMAEHEATVSGPIQREIVSLRG